MWMKRVKEATKNVSKLLAQKGQSADILNKELSMVAKAVDKAAKEQVIHRNKANRLKSRYAKKVTAYLSTTGEVKKSKEKSETRGTRTVKSKS